MDFSLLPGLGRILTLDIQARQVTTGTTAIPTVQPFSSEYFTEAAQPGLGWLSLVFLVLSAILLIGGAYVFFVYKNRWRRVHKLNYETANTWSMYALILGAVGVIFVVFRLLNIEGLNLRFWLYAVFLVMVVVAAIAAGYFRVRYPERLAAFEKNQKARGVSPAKQPRPQPTRSASTTPTAPERPAGSAGNPRGTSERGERRREKKR